MDQSDVHKKKTRLSKEKTRNLLKSTVYETKLLNIHILTFSKAK